eukprot:TRINITY_DN29609_c0_g2_i1.p1 TRINITY_DN29609_c0_g2~~TRINITY_DN29609_c0_g2_i1.p1  ORF type:complete len:742 (-),score=116.80 TRINITY_DN29609_c0_g2_i1:74-2191(-)
MALPSGSSSFPILLPIITGRCVEPIPRPNKLHGTRGSVGLGYGSSSSSTAAPATQTRHLHVASACRTASLGRDSEARDWPGSHARGLYQLGTPRQGHQVLQPGPDRLSPRASASSLPLATTAPPLPASPTRSCSPEDSPPFAATTGHISEEPAVKNLGAVKRFLAAREASEPAAGHCSRQEKVNSPAKEEKTKHRRASQRSRSSASNKKSADTSTEGSKSNKAKEEPKEKLLFVAQYGNHSALIRQILRNRPSWCPGPGDPGNSAGTRNTEERRVKLTPSDDLPEIHFLWSQYLVRDWLNAMADEQHGLVVALNEETKLQLKPKPADSQATQPVPSARAHNHFDGNPVLTSKAGLRETMVNFYLQRGRDPFGAVPLTFVVRKGSSDEQFQHWCRAFDDITESKGQRMWLVKPGDKSNQGRGIVVCDSKEEVQEVVESKGRVWVVQKYLEIPFLIHKRKFDIRSYCLLTVDPKDGSQHGYFYREAYLRTTSAAYSLDTKDRFVHLNNDAVQKHGDDYGKFESANKLSLADFQRYLDEHHPKERLIVQEKLVPQMRSLMADALKAAGPRMNPRNIKNCFEIFGFDFMVDASFRVWLIEINTNPCLELCNNYLACLIPKMMDEAFALSLDQMFPSAGRQGGSGRTGWEPIYNSAAPNASEVSCTWLPELPEDKAAIDLASLGRELLSPCQLRGQKKEKSSKAGAASAK